MADTLISIVWVLLAGSAFWLLQKRHRALGKLEASPGAPASWPSLMVIIPARNEEENLRGCLEDLLSQTYPRERLRVRVVNDASVDRTADIVRSFAEIDERLELVEAGALPAGWLGKTHACWVGSSGVQDDWLCFLDADTRPAPDLLRAAMSVTLTDHLDVLSLHPRQQMLGFWERLLMPVPFMTLMLLMDAEAINDPRRKLAMANGQFILVRREAYAAVGGHAAIRSEVLEDVRLAERLKGAGFRLRLAGGGAYIRTRMYSELKTIWQALARGGSEIFGIPLTLLAVPSSIGGAVFPLLYPISLALRAFDGARTFPALLIACLGSVLWYLAHALELRRHDVPIVFLALIPVSTLLVGIVNLEGVLRRVAGRRVWKGRRI